MTDTKPMTVDERVEAIIGCISACDPGMRALLTRHLTAHGDQVRQEVLNELSREIVHKIQMTNLETFKDGFEIRGAILELIKAKGGDDGE